MKKKVFLLIFVTLLVLNLVSAAYKCSDGSEIIEDQNEIKKYNKKTINGLELGLIYSDEIIMSNRALANLIINAEKISLSNQASSVKIEVKNKEYNLTLINITGDQAKIKVDSVSSPPIDSEDVTKVDGLEVFLFDIKGSYPGAGSLEALLGTEVLSISDKEDKLIKIDTISYALELISASEDNAIVMVNKCNTGEIVKIEEETPTNTSAENNPPINSSAENTSTINNSSELKNETIKIKNETSKIQNDTAKMPEKFFLFNLDYFTLAILGLILAIFIIFVVYLIKNKTYWKSA